MIYFEKRKTPPPSLAVEKAKGTENYRGQDVIDALSEDFKAKCYLCGTKWPTGINVEHFDEHRGDRNKMFDWNNLFYACAHCNNTKNSLFRTVPSNLLNCTIEDHKVDYWIEYRLETDGNLKNLKADIRRNSKVPVTPYEDKIANTIKLLQLIYNSIGTPIKNEESYNIINQINEELKDFLSLLNDYCFADSETEKNNARDQVIRSLENDKPYTAFKKWIIRDLLLEKDFEV